MLSRSRRRAKELQRGRETESSEFCLLIQPCESLTLCFIVHFFLFFPLFYDLPTNNLLRVALPFKLTPFFVQHDIISLLRGKISVLKVKTILYQKLRDTTLLPPVNNGRPY